MGLEMPGAERKDLDLKHKGEPWTSPFLLWASVSSSVNWVDGLYHWISYAPTDSKGVPWELVINRILGLLPWRFQFSWSRNLYFSQVSLMIFTGFQVGEP